MDQEDDGKRVGQTIVPQSRAACKISVSDYATYVDCVSRSLVEGEQYLIVRAPR
jgi:hypothetical protein